MSGIGLVAAALLGYLLGAIPSGVIVGRLRGVDPRSVGSGRTGTTNALRTLGAPLAALVLAIDVGKGVLAVVAGAWLAGSLGDPSEWAGPTAGVAVVAGHVRSVFIGFGGGRGVATGAAAVGILAPVALLAALPTFAVAVAATRFVSLGSILAAVMAVLAAAGGLLAGWVEMPRVAAVVIIALIVVLAHADNIGRLLSGTERRLGEPTASIGHG